MLRWDFFVFELQPGDVQESSRSRPEMNQETIGTGAEADCLSCPASPARDKCLVTTLFSGSGMEQVSLKKMLRETIGAEDLPVIATSESHDIDVVGVSMDVAARPPKVLCELQISFQKTLKLSEHVAVTSSNISRERRLLLAR